MIREHLSNVMYTIAWVDVLMCFTTTFCVKEKEKKTNQKRTSNSNIYRSDAKGGMFLLGQRID